MLYEPCRHLIWPLDQVIARDQTEISSFHSTGRMYLKAKVFFFSVVRSVYVDARAVIIDA